MIGNFYLPGTVILSLNTYSSTRSKYWINGLKSCFDLGKGCNIDGISIHLILYIYCGIIRICGFSIFVEFMGSPHPWIYIHPRWKLINKIKICFTTETENRRTTKFHPQKTHNPRNLTPTKLNYSTVFRASSNACEVSSNTCRVFITGMYSV